MATSRQYEENISVLMHLKPGDIVEFPKNIFYSHYGVYVGDGYVMHLGNEDTTIPTLLKGVFNFIFDFQKLFVKDTIVKQQFMEVAKDCTAKKNNYLDAEYKPYSREEIVKRALSMEGQQGYNLFFSNCQQFATWCRNGVNKAIVGKKH